MVAAMMMSKMTAMPLLPAKPAGTRLDNTPVTCRIIPIRPMMEPPAIKPLESETPEDNRVSRNALSFVSFSINNLSKAPTRIMDVVEIGR